MHTIYGITSKILTEDVHNDYKKIGMYGEIKSLITTKKKIFYLFDNTTESFRCIEKDEVDSIKDNEAIYLKLELGFSKKNHIDRKNNEITIFIKIAFLLVFLILIWILNQI